MSVSLKKFLVGHPRCPRIYWRYHFFLICLFSKTHPFRVTAAVLNNEHNKSVCNLVTQELYSTATVREKCSTHVIVL